MPEMLFNVIEKLFELLLKQMYLVALLYIYFFLY